MSIELYYTAPEDPIFEEAKQAAIKIWSGYDDTYGYASGKINHVKELKNIKDNFMHIFAMFDYKNLQKMLASLSPETKQAFQERYKDGQGE